MKSFKQFILEFQQLLEDRIDFLKQNLEGKLNTEHDPYGVHKTTSDIVDHFATHADPTKNKAHTQWILKQYQQGKIRQEDHPRIKEVLSNFEQHKKKLDNKDINSYKSLTDIEDAVKPHIGSEEPVSKRQETRRVKDEGSEVLHSSPNLTVRKLKTKEAACHYGAGTKWCTVAKEGNMFDYYNEDGPLYIFHHKDENGNERKFQYHPSSNQFMNERDEEEDMGDFVSKHPEVGNIPELSHLKMHNPDAKPEDIHKALNHENYEVRLAAINHRNVNSDHINKALGDKNSIVRQAAIKNEKATPEHIDKALNDSDHYVRRTAINNPNANSDNINKALDDKDFNVRISAINHERVSPKNISKALDDSDTIVKTIAIKNEKATPEHIDKALNDSDQVVRGEAVNNPNVNLNHIDKGLNDESDYVRRNAQKALENHVDNLPYHEVKHLYNTHPNKNIRDYAGMRGW